MLDGQNIWDFALNILVAILGGLARVLNIKDEKKLKVGRVLAELLSSAFIGSMFLMLARELKLSSSLTGMVCGMAGWSGAKALDIIECKLKQIVGVKEGVAESKENRLENEDKNTTK